MSAPDPEIHVEPDAERLAATAAARALGTLADAQRAGRRAQVALTAGSILDATLAAVAASPDRDTVEWDKVEVWWADERFVPLGSDDRNDKGARAALLDHLPLDAALVHPMPSSDGAYGDDLDAAAAGYAEQLAAAAGPGSDVPAFDVVLLGMGPDGHCASLFPDHPGVYVTDRPVVAVRNSPKPPPDRLSLSFPALDAAREIWVIASGSGKADAVGLAFSGAGRITVPVSGPRGQVRTLWLLDDAAAAGLPDGLHPDRA